MAKLNTNNQLDVANKMSLGVASSYLNKNYFEEEYDWRPQLSITDIFTDTVPYANDPTEADTNAINNPTILIKLVDYVMDEIPASNGQGYACYTIPGDNSSDKMRDFLLPQKFGPGYTFILKDNGNNVIPLTSGAYQLDYSNGVMRFNDSHTPTGLGWSLPLKLTCYQYIGARGSAGGSGGANLESEILTITTNAQTAFTITNATEMTDYSNIFLNGQRWEKNEGYTVTGTTLTWLNPITQSSPLGLTLETTDELVFESVVDSGSAGLTGTYTFGGGSSGDVSSMTFTDGLLTGVTTV